MIFVLKYYDFYHISSKCFPPPSRASSLGALLEGIHLLLYPYKILNFFLKHRLSISGYYLLKYSKMFRDTLEKGVGFVIKQMLTQDIYKLHLYFKKQ